MKIKEIKELNIKSVEELKSLVSKKKLDLSKIAVKITGGKEKNTKLIWKVKKEISQILTIMRMKEQTK